MILPTGKAKQLDQIQANYVVSLLNKGLIEGDRREAYFKENGRAKEVNYRTLQNDAVRKAERELQDIERG